jgi:hypothetical protein
MSREGRAAHAHRRARNDQREFTTVKPKPLPVGSDTTWVSSFIEQLEPGWFSADSSVALPIAGSHEERERMLRKASSMGLLQMQAYRENGTFIEYRWHLAS